MLDFEEGELAAKPLGRLALLLGDLDRVALQKGLRTGLRKIGFLQLKLWTPISPSLRGIQNRFAPVPTSRSISHLVSLEKIQRRQRAFFFSKRPLPPIFLQNAGKQPEFRLIVLYSESKKANFVSLLIEDNCKSGTS